MKVASVPKAQCLSLSLPPPSAQCLVPFPCLSLFLPSPDA